MPEIICRFSHSHLSLRFSGLAYPPAKPFWFIYTGEGTIPACPVNWYNGAVSKAQAFDTLFLHHMDFTSWELEIEMNKKDIAEIRKQFKLETDLLKIAEIYNVYI